MANFVAHEACPNCGSRDNLGRYDDGGAWCFGCGYREPPTHAPTGYTTTPTRKDTKGLPDDINHEFSPTCVTWLQSFHVDVPTAINNGLVWSSRYEQLIFRLGNVWQARNFNEERRSKYGKNYTSGDVNQCTYTYGDLEGTLHDEQSELILVEDPVSALRIGALKPSMPLLGSHLSTDRLNALVGRYNRFKVWLDSDKYKEACKIADRLRYVGIEASVIWTELDPKCYNNEQLTEYLK